jgi:hypothetical protein
MSTIKSLQDIFADDDLGLLNVKPTASAAQTADARFLASFAEINDFYRAHRREPNAQNGMNERMLMTRLHGIRENPQKVAFLIDHDEFGLLGAASAPLTSLADVFADDDLGLLASPSADSNEEDLFNLKHVSLTDTQRAEAEYVARRRPCKDFSLFEAQFKAVHQELVSGQRKLLPYTDSLLVEGRFYVHNGLLFYLEKIAIETESATLETGKRIRKDGRTRCVFENGTESTMLFRSVSKILYANGQAVSLLDDEAALELSGSDPLALSEKDQQTGFIYVLRSKSENPQISSIKNLFKIGYSTGDVNERIKNAKDDPTYLMAEVTVVAIYDCFNLNPQKFEQLIHQFFAESCLELQITGKSDSTHKPREWFDVPFNRIEHAIELIISKEIVSYRYDHINEEIVLK